MSPKDANGKTNSADLDETFSIQSHINWKKYKMRKMNLPQNHKRHLKENLMVISNFLQVYLSVQHSTQ